MLEVYDELFEQFFLFHKDIFMGFFLSWEDEYRDLFLSAKGQGKWLAKFLADRQ